MGNLLLTDNPPVKSNLLSFLTDYPSEYAPHLSFTFFLFPQNQFSPNPNPKPEFTTFPTSPPPPQPSAGRRSSSPTLPLHLPLFFSFFSFSCFLIQGNSLDLFIFSSGYLPNIILSDKVMIFLKHGRSLSRSSRANV
ncbi:hypothetical protein RND81_14G172200 [Saponaria officinalis]|uniref:Uncharacterized protein n=1 Tax=Saponaria officinalis TaxID=3572 RepID=A0AAW1GRH9_SAPOF